MTTPRNDGMSDNRFTPCPACSASVSADAYSCPQCGKPLRMSPSNIWAKATGEDPQTVELALENAKAWAFRCGNRQMATALNGLIDVLAYFSRKDVEPSLEFVIPIKR